MRVALGVALVAGLVASTGCTDGGGPGAGDADGAGPERVVKGLPAGWSGPEPDLIEGDPVVGWVGDDEFGVVAMGSSSCPPVAEAAEAVAADAVRIAFAESPNEICTADMAATTHVFALPGEVDERPVIVTAVFEEYGSEFVLELP